MPAAAPFTMSTASCSSATFVVQDDNSNNNTNETLPSSDAILKPLPLVPRVPLTLESWSTLLPSSTQLYLPKLLLGDVLVGASISFGISPFVAMVDQAIVQRSAGTHTILGSVQGTFFQMLRHPMVYFRSPAFVWMWALYTGTYGTANVLRTLQEHTVQQQQQQKEHESSHSYFKRDHGMMHKNNAAPSLIIATSTAPHHAAAALRPAKEPTSYNFSLATWSNLVLGSSMCVLAGTSSVNLTMSLLKDRAYAQLFGGHSQATMALPKISYALWSVRDFLVVGSTFLLPSMLVHRLESHGYIEPSQSASAQWSAQMVLPIASQVLAGPLHLLGLDLYHRPVLASSSASPLSSSFSIAAMRERAQCFHNGALTSVIVARMSRVVPGFSVGGVGNTYMRDQWRGLFAN